MARGVSFGTLEMAESMGLFRLEKRSFKGHTVAAFSCVKGSLGEKRVELLCVGLGAELSRGQRLGGGRT